MMAALGITCHNLESAAFANSRRDAHAAHSERSHVISTKKRDHVRALMATPEFEQSSDERKKIDALCAPEDPPPLRAHASTWPLRCSRRVPPRSYRAEP